MTNKEKNFISAVVYLHNDETRAEEFLRKVIACMKEHFENFEVVCVDDASQDKSVENIRRMSAEFGHVTVSILHMSYYHGLELAMNAGVDLAIGDFVYEFDRAFLDFDTEEIIRVYRKALLGYDIVSASPMRKEKLSSRMFYLMYQRFSQFQNHMNTESFRILSRRVINRVSSMNKTIPYRKAIYSNCGLKTANLKYEEIKGTPDEKKDRREKLYRRGLATDTLILFTDFGYRFSVWMTSLMMLIALLAAVYAGAVYVLGSPIEGWTTTILFLSVAFFGMFGIMTIIVKYLSILVGLIFKRQRYSFESIEKITG